MTTYIPVKEKAKDIRIALKKKFGITSKQVSVKSRGCGYSDSIDVTVKDLSIPVMLEDIESIARKHESIDRDQYTGEILSGANTYVHVNYDWDKYHQETLKYQDLAQRIIDKFHPKKNEGALIAKNNDWELFYFRELSNTPLSRIWIKNKNPNSKYIEKFSSCGKDNYDFTCVEGLSHKLVLFTTIYKIFSIDDFVNI